MACCLLGFTPEELCQMKLHQLLSGQHKTRLAALSEEQLDTKEGNTVILSGKVVSIYHNYYVTWLILNDISFVTAEKSSN